MNRDIRKFVNLILETDDTHTFFYSILWKVIYCLTDCIVELDEKGSFNKNTSDYVSKMLKSNFKNSLDDPRRLYCKLCDTLVTELNEIHTVFDTFKLLTVLRVLDDNDKLLYKNEKGELVRIIRWYPPVIKEYSRNKENIKFAKKLYSMYDILLSSYTDVSIWDVYAFEDYLVFNFAKDLRYDVL